MNIRFFNLLFFIFFGINNQLYASHDWYGKIFVDYQSISNDINGNKTDVKNNASRFGIKRAKNLLSWQILFPHIGECLGLRCFERNSRVLSSASLRVSLLSRTF